MIVEVTSWQKYHRNENSKPYLLFFSSVRVLGMVISSIFITTWAVCNPRPLSPSTELTSSSLTNSESTELICCKAPFSISCRPASSASKFSWESCLELKHKLASVAIFRHTLYRIHRVSIQSIWLSNIRELINLIILIR